MKKILITCISLLTINSLMAQTRDIEPLISLPDNSYLFPGNGFSSTSAFTPGSPTQLHCNFSFILNTGNINTGDSVHYSSSLNSASPTSTYQFFVLPQNANPGDTLFSIYDINVDSIHSMIDMPFYEQTDSVQLRIEPYDTFQPCTVYGLYLWLNFDPGAEHDPTNDLKIVPIIYDCNTTGTKDWHILHDDYELTLFPNPAKDHIQFSQYFERRDASRVIIRDALGRVVLQKNQAKFQGQQTFDLDISSLPQGIYSVELSSLYFRSTGKFVKQ